MISLSICYIYSVATNPRPQLLAFRVAEALATEMESWQGRVLPTLRELSGRFEVSLQTMFQAVQILKSRGQIEAGRGRRLRKATPPVPALKDEPYESGDRIFRILRSRILEGTYRQGTVLPKFSTLTGELKVTNRTAAMALHLLAAEDLIHRQGRIWLIGSDRSHQPSITVSSPPVIIVLQKDESSWYDLKQGGRERIFAMAFEREADCAGIQIIPAFMTHQPRLGDIFTAGIPKLEELITNLGQRYRGTLVAARPSEWPDFFGTLRRLVLKKRPLVWLDRYHEGDSISIKGGTYIRAIDSPASAFRLCLELFSGQGHRHMIMPLYWNRPGRWNTNSIRRMETAARGFPINCHMPTALFQSSDWRTELRRLKQRVRTHLHKSGREWLWKRLDIDPDTLPVELFKGFFAIRKSTEIDSLNLFRKWSPEESPRTAESSAKLGALISLLMLDAKLQWGATAILGITEFDAYHFFLWLRMAGLSVPGDFSIIASENLFQQPPYPLPITTVDFGFDRLGHDALHALLGDRPVRLDKKGALVAQPLVVQRGSVGSIGEL